MGLPVTRTLQPIRMAVATSHPITSASQNGWGYQSPEHFSRSEWLGPPVTTNTIASQNGWGYQSSEHFSRSESLGLPVTRTLQPIRMAGATSHPITSANQNGSGHQSPKRFIQTQDQKIIINIQCDRNEEWPPRFPHKLKPSNGAKDWLVLNKTVKIRNDRTAHCDATIGEWVVSH